MTDKPNTREWLKPVLAPLKQTFREVLTMSFFVNLMALAVPVFTLQVYDRVVFHAGISTLQGLVIGMALIVTFDYVLRQSRSRVMQTVALRVDVEVGRKLFRKLMALPLAVLETRPAAHWQALFRDVDVVRNTLSGASALLVADLPFALLFLGLIFVIAAPIAWVLLVILPLFMFVAWRSGNVMANVNKQERETTMSRDAMIAEMIGGRTTIKALALDNAMRPQWEDKHADNIKRSVTRGSKTDAFSNLGASLSTSTSIALTTVGAVAIIDQDITMGALIATNMLSGRLLGPLNQLVNQWRTYSSFRESVDRLGETFAIEGERELSEVSMQKPKGELEVEKVSFAYSEGAHPVVDAVEYTITAGGMHALVGRNGSGKTTLLKVLQGLYKPQEGRVTLDGADIAQFTRTELARWLGYVPQECVLFQGTVRDNIAHRYPDASDDEIIDAAKHSGVHQFIIDMPDGYATDIGEAGQRLSGGQRQRIAIARALVGDPPVLMLDEPSSSLDRQAEQELRATLVEIAKTRTVIIVTHSPILLAGCDDLVALDKGRIALAGPAQEILPRLFGTAAKPQGPAAQQPPQGAAPSPQPRPQPPGPPPGAPPRPQPPKAAQPKPGQPPKPQSEAKPPAPAKPPEKPE